jgi:hypothetical protein
VPEGVPEYIQVRCIGDGMVASLGGRSLLVILGDLWVVQVKGSRAWRRCPYSPAVLVLVLAATVVQVQGEHQRLPAVQPIPERSSEVGDGDLEVLREYKSTSIGGVEGVQEYIHWGR